MALTTEDLQQVENYLSGKGIHADLIIADPVDSDRLLVIHEDGKTGGYITFTQFSAKTATEKAEAAATSASEAEANAKTATEKASEASKSADAAADTLKECNTIKTEMDGQLSVISGFKIVNGKLCVVCKRKIGE